MKAAVPSPKSAQAKDRTLPVSVSLNSAAAPWTGDHKPCNIACQNSVRRYLPIMISCCGLLIIDRIDDFVKEGGYDQLE